jgi:hypothetical protein
MREPGQQQHDLYLVASPAGAVDRLTSALALTKLALALDSSLANRCVTNWMTFQTETRLKVPDLSKRDLDQVGCLNHEQRTIDMFETEK